MTNTHSQTTPKKITRVEIEEAAQGFILVDNYFEGWHRDQAPDGYETVEGVSLDAFVASLADQGFTVRIKGRKARALRGEITRFDFELVDNEWMVKRWPFGWVASTLPITVENKGRDFDFAGALKWLTDNHWTVIQWTGGARAWKGPMLPVRDRATILAMRRNAEEHHGPLEFHHFDIAFYY